MNIKLSVLILYVFLTVHGFAQIASSQSLQRRISFSLSMFEVESTPLNSKIFLENILIQFIRPSMIENSDYLNPRFLITCKISRLNREEISENKLFYFDLEIILLATDLVDGIVFNSLSIPVKGVGTNDEKAYTDAFRKIKTNGDKISRFMIETEEKVINYYESNCTSITSYVNNLIKQSKYDEALFKLGSIPSAALKCADIANGLLPKVYDEKLKLQCSNILYLANTFVSNNDYINAYALLQTIPSSSSCSGESKKLLEQLEKKRCSYYFGKAQASWSVRDLDLTKQNLMEIPLNSECSGNAKELIKEINIWTKQKEGREFTIENKKIDAEISIQKAYIEAARAIGIAYANSQAKTIIYNNRNLIW